MGEKVILWSLKGTPRFGWTEGLGCTKSTPTVVGNGDPQSHDGLGWSSPWFGGSCSMVDFKSSPVPRIPSGHSWVSVILHTRVNVFSTYESVINDFSDFHPHLYENPGTNGGNSIPPSHSDGFLLGLALTLVLTWFTFLCLYSLYPRRVLCKPLDLSRGGVGSMGESEKCIDYSCKRKTNVVKFDPKTVDVGSQNRLRLFGSLWLE